MTGSSPTNPVVGGENRHRARKLVLSKDNGLGLRNLDPGTCPINKTGIFTFTLRPKLSLSIIICDWLIFYGESTIAFIAFKQ